MLYDATFRYARESLLYYGKIRTRDGKGVTIPSQKRYVYNYEAFLKSGLEISQITNPEYQIERIVFGPKPKVTNIFSSFCKFL